MNREIYFATQNKGKVNSLKRSLSRYGINVIHACLDLPEPRTDDLHEIAKQKVLTAYEKVKKPVLALDAGFYVFSLKGFPGAFVNHALKTIGIGGVLKLIEDKPKECEFKECLSYYDGKLEQPLIFESRIKGILATKPRGKMGDYAWSKLSLVFVPEGLNKTLAEMGSEEYLRWSRQRHNTSYVTEFAKWFLGRK